MSGHVLRNTPKSGHGQDAFESTDSLHSLEASGVEIWGYVSPSMQNPECVLGFGGGADSKRPTVSL